MCPSPSQGVDVSISIYRVDNGYRVVVLSYGGSETTETYNHVYNDPVEMLEFITERLGIQSLLHIVDLRESQQ